jgi:hypothetical protein
VAVLDLHVEPISFHIEDSGRIVVDVHTIVRSLEGKILADEKRQHLYSLEDGLIRSMEILRS